MSALIASSSGWHVGLILGSIAVAVVALIVIVIVALALKIAGQARAAVAGVEKVREQTVELPGIARINDSGTRILRAARSVRKVAVGR